MQTPPLNIKEFDGWFFPHVLVSEASSSKGKMLKAHVYIFPELKILYQVTKTTYGDTTRSVTTPHEDLAEAIDHYNKED